MNRRSLAGTPDAAVRTRPPVPKGRSVFSREFWSRHLRQWHWISSAVCLTLMLLFAFTGITLNHAEIFESRGQSTVREFPLSGDLAQELSRVKNGAAVPERVAAEIRRQTGADLAARTVDNQYGEIVFDLARPGRDASLTIDLNAQQMSYEEIDRGTVAMLNDLHKGRHAGAVWKLLIDVGALFFIVFAVTGFGLLALQARMRVSTWPLASLGLVAPVVIYLLLVH